MTLERARQLVTSLQKGPSPLQTPGRITTTFVQLSSEYSNVRVFYVTVSRALNGPVVVTSLPSPPAAAIPAPHPLHPAGFLQLLGLQAAPSGPRLPIPVTCVFLCCLCRRPPS